MSPGEGGSFTLSPAATQVAGQVQGLIVDVPDQGIDTTYTAPASGDYAWWTSSADDLNTTLTRSLDLTGIRNATVTARAWYDIEAGYDYLFAEYSTDAGAHWTQIGSPVDGSSNGRWKTLRYSVPGGAPLLFRFRYQTDGGVHLPGAFLDDIAIKSGGTSLFSDDVEQGDNGWTAVGGFKQSTGTETTIGDRYYLAENRTYTSYDDTLRTGPYQFSYGLTAPNKVERFPFQDGLLVWAVDETYGDNNTIDHPGHGQALPVDARPDAVHLPGWDQAEQPAPAVRRDLRPAGHGRRRPPQGGRRRPRPQPDHRVGRRGGAVEPGHPDVHGRRDGRLLVVGKPAELGPRRRVRRDHHGHGPTGRCRDDRRRWSIPPSDP